MGAPNRTKHQSFTSVVVARGDVKNAPYNPRRIDDEARARLKRRIKSDGLLGPITWNRRTGNIVGGHQRIGILDELEGSAEYRLTVAAIDIPEDQEKRLNIFLNNREAQGTWDNEKLSAIIADMGEGEIDWLGFEEGEIGLAFDKGEMPGLHGKETPQATADKATIAEMKEARKAHVDDTALRYDDEFYCVLVFKTTEAKENFCAALGAAKSERFVRGDKLCRKET